MTGFRCVGGYSEDDITRSGEASVETPFAGLSHRARLLGTTIIGEKRGRRVRGMVAGSGCPKAGRPWPARAPSGGPHFSLLCASALTLDTHVATQPWGVGLGGPNDQTN